jgi:hypothetical protein
LRVLKSVIKRIGFAYIKLILIKRREMLDDKNNKTKILINEFKFKPNTVDPNITKSKYSYSNDFVKVSPLFLCKINNVTLIGPYGIPFTSYGRIIQEKTQDTTLKYIQRTISYLGIIEFVKQYLYAIFRLKRYDLEFGFHLVPRHGYGPDLPNFCHWLFEDLPQLFSFKKSNKDSKIILNKTINKFQIQSLELMGFLKNDLYQHDNISTKVKSLYISNMRTAQSKNSERDPNGRFWVAKQLKKNILPINSKKNKYVFISRQNLNHKYFLNIEEINEVLLKYGVETFQAGKNNLENDIAVFSNADIIIAPRGAGLANMIFAKKTCHIIEIGHYKNWEKDIFFSTALDLGLSFDSVEVELSEISKSDAEVWNLNPLLLEEAILRWLNNK